MAPRALTAVLLASAYACMSTAHAATPRHEDNRAVCSSLSSHSTVFRDADRLILEVALENPSQMPIELEAFALGQNMLRFSASEVSTGRSLKVVIPLISPGVEPVRIAPGSTVVRKFDLAFVFPDLGEALTRTSVEVSWKMTLKPAHGCSSQEVETRMTLKR